MRKSWKWGTAPERKHWGKEKGYTTTELGPDTSSCNFSLSLSAGRGAQPSDRINPAVACALNGRTLPEGRGNSMQVLPIVNKKMVSIQDGDSRRLFQSYDEIDQVALFFLR